MANAKLIPCIGIVDRKIGDDKVGQQQLLEHVGMDAAGPLLEVGAKCFQTRLEQRRLDQFGEDRIEVDRSAIQAWLHSERRDHECARPL